MKKTMYLLPAFFLITSCDRNPFMKAEGKISVAQTLTAATQANANAPTYADWHSSEFHPEKVFAKFLSDIIEKKISANDVCDSLLKMKEEDLILFENEISKKENIVAVEPCYDELTVKMENYWQSQKIPVQLDNENASGDLSIRFEKTEVQFREVSRGYFAYAGDLARKQVVLSFDDGPHPTNTQKVLDTLKKANVRAIFFEMADNVRRYPHLTQKVADAGHSLGSHSITHSCLPATRLCKRSNGGHMFTIEEAVAEIRGGHQAIFDVLGWVDPFFRFPYGESSPELKAYLREHSVGEFYWNIDSEDWKTKLKNGMPNTPATVIESVMQQLHAEGRGIILFHDIQRKTAEALPAMLRRLYDEGYQPVVLQAKDPQARFHSKLVGPRDPKP